MGSVNFREFIEEVESNVATMAKSELIEFIYELARTTNSEERSAFLDKFRVNKGQNREDELKKVSQFFCAIEEAQIYFRCSSYEDYSNGYWGREWIYNYTDYFDIGKTLQEAFALASNLMYEKSYVEADELYNQLLSLSILAYDEDMEEMLDCGLDISEVVQEGILSIDLIEVCNNTLYAAYQVTSGKKRAETIYLIYQRHRSLFWEKPLEGMLSVGPEPLAEVEGFMRELSQVLKDQTGEIASRLLGEAIPYIKEDPAEFAREFAASHPKIYYNLCKEAINQCAFEKAIELGMQALDHIPKNLRIRSKIAYMIAEACKETGEVEKYARCLFEGFISTSSPINFLKLFGVCDREKINEAYSIAADVPANRAELPDVEISEQGENYLTHKGRAVIRFLNGDLEFAKKKCMKDKEYLGWSLSYKGICIPLFLLLLEVGNNSSKARSRIIHTVILGMGGGGETYDLEYAEQLLQEWKRGVIVEDKRGAYLKWVSVEVDCRVNAVVGGGYRNSYYKAAQLIVYLGQVLESNGEIDATQRLEQEYKKQHTRKRAFKAELDELLMGE